MPLNFYPISSSAGESCYFNNDSATDFNPHSGCKKREAGPYKGDQYCDTDFCGPVGYDLQKACDGSDNEQAPKKEQGLRCYYCTEYLDTYPHPRDPRYACRPQPGACGAIFDVEQTKICKGGSLLCTIFAMPPIKLSLFADGESCYFNNDPELGSTYIPHSGCGRKGAKKALKGDQFCDTDFCGPIGYKVKDACKGKSNGVGWKWSSRILVAIFGTLAAFSEI